MRKCLVSNALLQKYDCFGNLLLSKKDWRFLNVKGSRKPAITARTEPRRDDWPWGIHGVFE